MKTTVRFVLALAWRDLQLSFTSRVPFLFDLLGTLGALALYYFVGRFVRPSFPEGALGFFAFVSGGIAILRMQAALVKSVQALEREQVSGTLELILISPVPAAAVAVGTCLYELARGGAFAIVVLLASRFMFGAGLTLGPRAWAGIACGMAGAAVFFVALSVLASSVLVAFKQGPAFAGLLTLGIPVLSGAFFPVQVLPQPLHAVADALPLTMAIKLLREGVITATFSPGRAVLMLAILILVFPLVLLVFSASVNRAKRLGTLGHQ
jgi:ABC-type polysaccharide/polyol phosphate export permease